MVEKEKEKEKNRSVFFGSWNKRTIQSQLCYLEIAVKVNYRTGADNGICISVL